MRFLLLTFMVFSSISVGATSSAEEKFTLGDKLNLTPACQIGMSGRGYYLNTCPTGMVMVGANPLPGNPNAMQVLCASLLITCSN